LYASCCNIIISRKAKPFFTTRRGLRDDSSHASSTCHTRRTRRGLKEYDTARAATMGSPAPAPDLAKSTVAQLRARCANRGLSTDGLKAALIARLAALDDAGDDENDTARAPKVVDANDGRKRDRERGESEDKCAAQPSASASADKTPALADGTSNKRAKTVDTGVDDVDDDFKTLVRIDQNAGRVIGRGGETLKYIERRCGVRLEFRRDEGVVAVRPKHEVDKKIVSDDAKRANVQEAKRIITEVASTGQIMDRLTENVPSDINAGIRIDSNVVPHHILNGDPEEYLEVDIPCPGKEGRVIGRGAETIREISARSGANCHVVKGSGVCTAKGKRHALAIAYQMVHDTLQLPIDRFGAPSTSQPHQQYVHAPMVAAPAAAPLMMAVPPGVVMLPNGMAMVPMSMLGVAPAQGVMPMMAPQPAPTTTIEVPCATHAGRIVGKGGEMIKHLRAVTGCAVDLKDNNTPNAVCVISGPVSAVELCRSYVHEVMENGDTRAAGKLGVAPMTHASAPTTHASAPGASYPQHMATPYAYTASLATPVNVGGWERYHDDSGKAYEHNAATGETRWVD